MYPYYSLSFIVCLLRKGRGKGRRKGRGALLFESGEGLFKREAGLK